MDIEMIFRELLDAVLLPKNISTDLQTRIYQLMDYVYELRAENKALRSVITICNKYKENE